jgi:hypothetical protein
MCVELFLVPHHCMACCVWFAGVRAACAAGVPVIGITSGQAESVLWDAGCSMLIEDFAQLLQLALQQCKAGEGTGEAAARMANAQLKGQQASDVLAIVADTRL